MCEFFSDPTEYMKRGEGIPLFRYACTYDICDVDIDMLRIEAHHIRISIYTLPIDECPISSLRGATGRDGDGDPAYGHGH